MTSQQTWKKELGIEGSRIERKSGKRDDLNNKRKGENSALNLLSDMLDPDEMDPRTLKDHLEKQRARRWLALPYLGLRLTFLVMLRLSAPSRSRGREFRTLNQYWHTYDDLLKPFTVFLHSVK